MPVMGMQPARLALIDGLRGGAAFFVLLWHYQHFYWYDHPRLGAELDTPFHRILGLGYKHGDLGVPVFWIISGFVFATVYRASSASAREFAINRFARLYPLHFITLTIVAALQAMAFWYLGRWLIYDNNDFYHFTLQILFVSGWGFERGTSFNGPIWSVSVELVIYAVFWTARQRLEQYGVLWPVVMATAFAGLFKVFGDNITLCGFFFFLGCACASFHFQTEHKPHWRWAGAAGCFLGGIGMHFAGSRPLTDGVAGIAVGLILALASAEKWAPEWFRRLCGAMGDYSYGVYLWHIPVQLVLLLVIGPSIALLAPQGWFLVLFIGMVLVCAGASFKFIECPLRGLIRRQLI